MDTSKKITPLNEKNNGPVIVNSGTNSPNCPTPRENVRILKMPPPENLGNILSTPTTKP